jgi:hypothetical protein
MLIAALAPQGFLDSGLFHHPALHRRRNYEMIRADCRQEAQGGIHR